MSIEEIVEVVLAEHGENDDPYWPYHLGCACEADDALLPEKERTEDFPGSRESWAAHVARIIKERLEGR